MVRRDCLKRFAELVLCAGRSAPAAGCASRLSSRSAASGAPAIS